MSVLDGLGGFVLSGLVVVLLAFLDRWYHRQGWWTDRARVPRRESEDRR